MARAIQQTEVDILGVDGVLYKGRMTNQRGVQPPTSMEELAGEEHQAFLGTPALGPGFAGQHEGMGGGRARAGTIPDWGSSHSHLQKWGPAL